MHWPTDGGHALTGPCTDICSQPGVSVQSDQRSRCSLSVLLQLRTAACGLKSTLCLYSQIILNPTFAASSYSRGRTVWGLELCSCAAVHVCVLGCQPANLPLPRCLQTQADAATVCRPPPASSALIITTSSAVFQHQNHKHTFLRSVLRNVYRFNVLELP